MKHLLLTLTTLLLIGCSPNSPSHKSFRHTQPTTASTNAILKLDTKGHTALIRDIIVTKSGDIISASDDKTIRVWSSTTGEEKAKILGQIGAGSEGKIYAIALSPDEKFLAIGGFINSGDNERIRIYNYQTGRLLKVLKSHTNIINDLAFSSDGKYLISGSADKTAKIWSVDNFSLVDTIKSHTNHLYAVKIIKKDKRYFAITAGDDNQIFLYDMQKREIIKSDKKSYNLDYLAISKNHIAVCGSGREIQIYDHSLNPIKTISSETKPQGLAYSPNGEFLIAGTGARPLNVNTYSVKEDYSKRGSFKKHTNLTMAVAFLDNQTAVSGGGENNEIYIWDRDSARVKREIEGVAGTVWSVGVRGDSLAWGNKGRNVHNNNSWSVQKMLNLKTFDINTKIGSEKFKRIMVETRHALSLRHRAGGSYGYGDAVLDIKQSGKTLASITRGSTNGYSHRCYGFYQDYIISGGSNGQLKIYNQQGREVANLVGHTGEVWSIALDGDRLVSGSDDQTIRVWNLSQLKMNSEKRKMTIYPQLNVFVSKDNEWIMWTPEGFYNASKGAEQYIGYHINRGANQEAEFLDVSRFRKQFYRPDLIAKAVAGKDISHYARGIDIDTLLDAGLPPKVEILSDSHTINTDSTEIGVKVCNQGGGVANLSFYLDGKPIEYQKNTKAFQHRKEQRGGCTTIVQRITIPSGVHTIGFNATNQKGVLSNRPTITVTNNQKVTKKPNLHLLTLSISDYKDDELDLKFPNNDADKLSQKLKTIGKPVFDKVHTYALKDSQVTQQNIKTKVAEIAQKIGAEDVFILYISGHGVTNDADGDYYFIPYDCPNGADVTKRAINQQQFIEIISQIKAPKSVLLLDTCESGSMASGDIATGIERFGLNIRISILAGATSQQNAIDGYKEHGIFTYTLLDAMGRKDLYYENEITVPDLIKHSNRYLPKLAKEKFGHEQKPVSYQQGDTSFAIGGM